MGSLVLNGFLQAGGDGCGCSDSSGGSGCTERLGLRCSPGTYQSILSTDAPIRVSTPGAVGDAFVPLAMLGDFVGIEFLYVKSNAPIALCIDAGSASLTSDAITLPTGFVGGETMTVTIDQHTPVVVTFLAGDQTLAQVVARINAAFALAGLPTPRCEAVGTTKLKITAIECGPSSEVLIGAAPAIPFTTSLATGNGSIIEFAGTFMIEFNPYPDSPSRVEVSGQASISVLAAGRTSV